MEYFLIYLAIAYVILILSPIQFYKKLRQSRIYWINFILAILFALSFFLLRDIITHLDSKVQGLLFAPASLLLIYKALDNISLKQNQKHIVLAVNHTFGEDEPITILDKISIFIIIICSLFIPSSIVHFLLIE